MFAVWVDVPGAQTGIETWFAALHPKQIWTQRTPTEALESSRKLTDAKNMIGAH